MSLSFIVCFTMSIMSTKSNFVSNQKIPQEATQLNKLTKVSSGYMEISSFKDSDTHRGSVNLRHYFMIMLINKQLEPLSYMI